MLRSILRVIQFLRAHTRISAVVTLLTAANLFAFQNCVGKGFSSASGDSLSCVTHPSGLGCAPTARAQCFFNGQTFNNGQTVVAFVNSTAAAGSSCVSETRTCLNGVMTGSYSYPSCTVGGRPSCLFNGFAVSSGETIAAYAAPVGTKEAPCRSETRTCVDGVLSGSFTSPRCFGVAPSSCLFNGRVVQDHESIPAFASSSVPSGASCQSEDRTCYNGVLSGRGDYSTCNVEAPKSCLFNALTLASGEETRAFAQSTVPFGQTCQSILRTCTNGVLSGEGAFSTCAVDQPQACVINGQTVGHGTSINLFVKTDVGPGETCQTETRTCFNGTLSGSATATACVAHEHPLLSSLVATDGQDVTIPAGTIYEIDPAKRIGELNVQGQLFCPSSGSVTLRIQALQIFGDGALLQCGTPEARFAGQFNIEITNGRVVLGSEGTFAIHNGGTLRLVGDAKNATWLRLSETAEVGATVLKLTGAVNWTPGEHIALAPTGFDAHEAEELVIASVGADQRSVTLTTPVAHRHWGGVQNFSSSARTWSLDESAEVANLNRNIRIYTPGTPELLDYRGGHVMAMGPGASAYIDAVEFRQLGRMDEMKRYPFHWHFSGDVTGQYIANSSLHDTFQRCVTVHQTNNALVQNNVCYNHFGHGFFLEDGNEVGNHIVGNLGILTKVPLPGRNLLQSDIDRSQLPRWAGPATFWISNPSNVIANNVAAGSEGSGFWNSFVQGLNCSAAGCQTVVNATLSPNVTPALNPLTQFDGNVAHSNLVGMSWDGAEMGELSGNPHNAVDRLVVASHYYPPTMPVVRRNVTTKNAMTGVYFRGQPFTFDDSIFADNANSLWMAYNQRVTNSAVIGMSANYPVGEVEKVAALGGDITRMGGVWLYDGPLWLTNVDFLAFPTSSVVRNGLDITPVPFRSVGGADHSTNRVAGLRFAPEPYRRFIWQPNVWADSPYSVSVHDVDGSLTGVADALLVPDAPILNDGSCVPYPGTRTMRCNYETGRLFLAGGAWGTPFQYIREDQVASAAVGDLGPSPYFNKANFILNQGHTYTVRIAGDVVGMGYVPLSFSSERIGSVSPVLRLADVGSGCNVANATPVGSLAQLNAAGGSAFFASGQDLYLKLFTQNSAGVAPEARFEGVFVLSCAMRPAQDTVLNPLVFDATYYRAAYPDLAGMDENQLRAHWVNNGLAEGRTGREAFSPTEYLAMWSDLRAAFGASNYRAAAEHFVSSGAGEGRTGRFVLHPFLFTEEDYRGRYPDLSLLFVHELLHHWLSNGIEEGRSASVLFSRDEYLALNPDVNAAVGTDPTAVLNHFARSGYAEGRAPRYLLSPLVYNSSQYIGRYADLAAAFHNVDKPWVLAHHWINNGLPEGRQGNNAFSPPAYLARYPEVAAAVGAGNNAGAATHFVTTGSAQGLNGSP